MSQPPLPSRQDDSSLLNGGPAMELEEQAGSSLVPDRVLEPDEIVLYCSRPSFWYVWLGCLNVVFVVVLILVGVYVVSYEFHENFSGLPAHLPGGGLLLIVLRWLWLLVDWYFCICILTNHRLITLRGFWSGRPVELLLAEARYPAIQADWRQRLLGIGTIGLARRGCEYVQYWWPMMAKPREVHQLIVQAIEAQSR